MELIDTSKFVSALTGASPLPEQAANPVVRDATVFGSFGGQNLTAASGASAVSAASATATAVPAYQAPVQASIWPTAVIMPTVQRLSWFARLRASLKGLFA